LNNKFYDHNEDDNEVEDKDEVIEEIRKEPDAPVDAKEKVPEPKSCMK
jgi:hypothetical protein